MPTALSSILRTPAASDARRQRLAGVESTVCNHPPALAARPRGHSLCRGVSCTRTRRFAGIAAALLGATLACEPSPPTHQPEAGVLVTDSEPSSARAPSSSVRAGAPSSSGPQRLPVPAATAPASGECLLVPRNALRRISPGRYQLTRLALTGAQQELASHPRRWFRPGALEWITSSEGQPVLRIAGLTASDCGLRNKDLLVSIQGTPVANLKRGQASFVEQLAVAPQVDVVVLRDGKRQDVHYEVVERLL